MTVCGGRFVGAFMAGCLLLDSGRMSSMHIPHVDRTYHVLEMYDANNSNVQKLGIMSPTSGNNSTVF